jgi:hypothetical protein
MQEFGKMALGPVGSVVRVRTRASNGTINVSTVTRISAKKDGSTGSTPSQSVSSQIQDPRGSTVVSAPLMGRTRNNSNNIISSSSQPQGQLPAGEHAIPRVPSAGPPRRSYPAKASMLWDYDAARDDELTAKAGDELLIAGDYKNQGWVWGAHVTNGGEPVMPYMLVPANYIQYDEASDNGTSIPGQGYPSQHNVRSSPIEAAQIQAMDAGQEVGSGELAWEVGHTREELIGDESDPLLDGMWEDENGMCSVNC